MRFSFPQMLLMGLNQNSPNVLLETATQSSEPLYPFSVAPAITTTSTTATTSNTTTSTLLRRIMSTLDQTGHSGFSQDMPRYTPLVFPDASLNDTERTTPSLDDQSVTNQAATDTNLYELEGIIPLTILAVGLSILLAWLLYLTIRKAELRMPGWCYRNCRCCSYCCVPSGMEGGRALKGERCGTLREEPHEKEMEESISLRDYREKPSKFILVRSSSKEYTPKGQKRNPC